MRRSALCHLVCFVVCGVAVASVSPLALATPTAPPAAKASKKASTKPSVLVDATTVVDDLRLDIRYATPNNFVGENVYGDNTTCRLQRDAALMLKTARTHLAQRRPDLRFLVFDCLRPRSVQRRFWAKVVGTPQQSYVANPNSETGSIHNYGCAIDLSLATTDGKELDLGTPFDHFGPRAHPPNEIDMLGKQTLTHEQLANRLLLREVMVRAGFYPLDNEWWHFNCALPVQTRARYSIVE